ncbi:unnamed protein product [Arctia plantaginis]|uniref:Uncharacterized protein n=1 Tax=Arctia plantaginis TaxID=874455 RepID=A0A8S0Z506_ARCPL|nr:unnamed protein product [Arctia plantaginis]
MRTGERFCGIVPDLAHLQMPPLENATFDVENVTEKDELSTCKFVSRKFAHHVEAYLGIDLYSTLSVTGLCLYNYVNSLPKTSVYFMIAMADCNY